MNASRAKDIADHLHMKWVSDNDNNGAYTLELSADQTAEFFADLLRMITEDAP